MSKLQTSLLLLLFLFPLTAIAKESEATLSVKVRETKLRAQPKAWAPGTVTLNYGDKMNVIGTEEGWFKVKTAAGKDGYVHPSAVTDRTVVLNLSKSQASKQVDSSDVVLAGKGFSKEVEKDYALKNPSLKFGELNSIERVKLSEGELVAFMRQGNLGKGRL